MSRQSGIGLVELVIVLGLASLVVGVTVAYSVPWMARENLRSSIQDVRNLLQLTRMEAVGRNRECRFEIDTTSGRLRSLDTMGTDDRSDDVPLYDSRLPSSLVLARPNLNAPVTMAAIGGTKSFEVVFRSDGSVESGAGDLWLHGGQGYGSVAVHGAGGIEIVYMDAHQRESDPYQDPHGDPYEEGYP
jgi:Tfp pilus assembly protein FimT